MQFIQQVELARLLNRDLEVLLKESPQLVGHEESHLRVVQQEQFIRGLGEVSPALEHTDPLDRLYL